MEYMYQLIKHETKLSDCARKILRAVFTQKIATRLTLCRYREHKILMAKDLPVLKNCILGSYLNYVRNKSKIIALNNILIFFSGALERKKKKLHISMKLKCLSVLSNCITRATDWDSHRLKEKRKTQNENSLSDYVADEESS